MERLQTAGINSATNNQGFTLMELLYVVAIIGILSSIALPSFSEQIKSDRLITNANKLHSIFKFARSEAVKREQTVTLNEDSGDWHVEIGGEVLLTYTPTHSSIVVSGLADMSISITGETNVANLLVTDGYNGTTDQRLCILSSGQSLLTQGACP